MMFLTMTLHQSYKLKWFMWYHELYYEHIFVWIVLIFSKLNGQYHFTYSCTMTSIMFY